MGLGSFIKKGLKKITKPFRKVVKGIAKGVRKIGRVLKRGLGKVAKTFGKLGPLGSIALSFMLPGIGSALSSWYGGLGSGNIIKIIGDGIVGAAQAVKGGVGRVFSSITNGIEYGMNAVSRPFMQEGARGAGSAFRDFVSNATGGMIDKSAITKGDGMFSSEYVTDASGKSFGDMTFKERDAFKADLSDTGFTAQTNIAQHNRNVKSISKQASKFQTKNQNLDKIVSQSADQTTIQFRDVDGKITKTFKTEMPKIKTSTINEIATGTTPPVDNRRIMAKLNDPDVGLYDAITEASPERSYYTKITALQAYDYATNPLNLTEDEMNEHRRSRAAYQSDAMGLLQENQAKNLNTLYDLGNQVVSTAASAPANSSVYDYWLNQIYGNSMQGMSSQAAINAPVYGMQFEDYLTA